MSLEQRPTAAIGSRTKHSRRPPKYRSAEEKANARREQVLRAVKAWRKRQAIARGFLEDDNLLNATWNGDEAVAKLPSSTVIEIESIDDDLSNTTSDAAHESLSDSSQEDVAQSWTSHSTHGHASLEKGKGVLCRKATAGFIDQTRVERAFINSRRKAISRGPSIDLTFQDDMTLVDSLAHDYTVDCLPRCEITSYPSTDLRFRHKPPTANYGSRTPRLLERQKDPL